MRTDPPHWRRCFPRRVSANRGLPFSKRLAALTKGSRPQPASAFSLVGINPLNLVAIEVVADPDARILPLAPGLADDLFEHDGQITKREIRAATLSALAPRRGELLWDIGAGSGSVAIEWMLADPSMRAVAIEADPERAARIGRNAKACGVPGLEIVEGRAPAALTGLAAPDAVFIGGGGSDNGVLPAVDRSTEAWRAFGRQRGDAGNGSAFAGKTYRTRRRIDPHRGVACRPYRLDARLAARDAGHAMVLGEAMVIAGIGCRKGVSAEEVLAAIAEALDHFAVPRPHLDALATGEIKLDEGGIAAASAKLGLPLQIVGDRRAESGRRPRGKLLGEIP